MAISLDNSTNGGSTTGTSLTFSHTCSGSNRILFVHVATNTANNTDYISGVTYAGISMSVVDSFRSAGLGGSKLFMLVNPTSGSNDVVVSLSSSVEVYAVASSYNGALQTGQPNTTGGSAIDPTTSLTVNVTTTEDKCWLISAAAKKAGSSATISAGDNTVSRQINVYSAIGDSNASQSPAGTYGQTWNLSSSSGIAVHVVAIVPAPERGIFFHNFL